ncbi:Glutamyl aminopeptidase [Trachymyrmex cornetzi]|uniref:Glutamyl aminopeptidase n=1 Tax=Trachymyrmex cornetzi TaxID=471704 RepID=A0A195E232_9HYME|nr:Glutamyl aminopeptidase [Trachymyrmex cornetzi]
MRQLFPCWDIPHLKATFAISIKHHRNLTALSNMPIKYHSTNHTMTLEAEVLTHFCTTPPMSTLQVAIVVTDYYNLKVNDNITLWCDCYSEEKSPKFEFARRIINDITSHLKSEFGGINIPKMDHVAIPNFPQDGTSKWGLIFHTEANLICNEQSDSIMHKIEVARLIAPKIAYQWFSNVFSYNWWTQFWLHDGLATLFGEETIVKIFNDSKIMDFLMVQNQYESLHLDSHFDMNPQIINLLKIDSLFSFPRYLKALIALRMLQSAITDKVFRKNVRTYVNRYTFSSMVSFDFWSMQEPIEAFKCYIPSNEFLTWITYSHYQIVTFEQAEADSYTGRLSQKYNPIGQGRWWILINLKNYKLRITETLLTKNFTTCLTPDSPSVTLYVQQIDWAYDWVVNIQRVVYIYIYIHKVIYRYIKSIDKIYLIYVEFRYELPVNKKGLKWIEIFCILMQLLDNPLRVILIKKHLKENDLTESFKQEILKWSCTLKHYQCAMLAEDTLGDHLQNPEIEPVSAEWKHWTYCRGFILCFLNKHSLWFKASYIWLRKPDHDLLPFLACCETDSIITVHLQNLFLNRFTQNEREDVVVIRSSINIFHSVVSKHANNYNILRKILGNLGKIKPNSVIFIIVITTINGAEVNNFIIPKERLPDYVIPVHYTIKLTHMIYHCSIRSDVFCEEILGYSSFPNSFPFFGEISTTINILQSTQYIRMHQVNLTIINRNITLTKDNGIIYVLDKHRYTYHTNILEFPLSYILLPGLYTFKMEFFGHLSENHKSIYKYFLKESGIVLLLAPQIQANGVRQLFPCWDEPHLKTTFNIAMKHSRYQSVLSNMPTKFITHDKYNNLLCTYFDITPPISTFQVAIVVTNYNYIKIKENITLWLYSSEQQSPKLEFARRIINDITSQLKSEFGGINIPKMDHVAIPNFPQDGTSKWGLVFHTEANLIYDEQPDLIMRKIEIARLIAPKIAYQWFSNVFSYDWWTQFWLHDGLATLFGEETIVKVFYIY